MIDVLSLKDKVVLITGGGSGIGKTIALSFAERGARVVIFDINEEVGGEAVKEICQHVDDDKAAKFYTVDVSKSQSVNDAIQAVLSDYSRVDVLVNNAGITRDTLLMKMTEDQWDAVLNVNLKSVYNMCHALVRPMIKARKGKIINIASVIGLIGNAGQANYAASKAGVIGFTKSMAREVGARGVCVNAIAPGYIRTNMTDVLSEDIKKSVISKVPLGRMGEAIDIANTALFLASNLSDYITGQVVVVDGGMVM